MASGCNRPLWNPYNVLTRFDNSTGTIASQQAYDGFGQRVWTQVTGGPSQHYVYDGDMIIGEITKTGGATGYPSAVYTWGPDGLISERLDPRQAEPRNASSVSTGHRGGVCNKMITLPR